jgi:uncharacterized protein with HEPN domain
MALEQFMADRKTADAVVRNLEIIGEAARALPPPVRDLAPEIEWRKIIGLRTLIAHAYFGINLPIVWDVVVGKLPILEQSVQRLMKRADGDMTPLSTEGENHDG